MPRSLNSDHRQAVERLLDVLVDELLDDADAVAGLVALRKGFLARTEDVDLLVSLARQPRDKGVGVMTAAMVLALDVGTLRRDEPLDLNTTQGGGG